MDARTFSPLGEDVTTHFRPEARCGHTAGPRRQQADQSVAGGESVSGLRTSRRSVDLSGVRRASYGCSSRRNGRPHSAISSSTEVVSRRDIIPPWGNFVNPGFDCFLVRSTLRMLGGPTTEPRPRQCKLFATSLSSLLGLLRAAVRLMPCGRGGNGIRGRSRIHRERADIGPSSWWMQPLLS
jgi:hypothetical protein